MDKDVDHLILVNMLFSFEWLQQESTMVHQAFAFNYNDNVEMRLCKPDGSGSTPIEIVELYVQ